MLRPLQKINKDHRFTCAAYTWCLSRFPALETTLGSLGVRLQGLSRFSIHVCSVDLSGTCFKNSCSATVCIPYLSLSLPEIYRISWTAQVRPTKLDPTCNNIQEGHHGPLRNLPAPSWSLRVPDARGSKVDSLLVSRSRSFLTSTKHIE